MLSAATELSAEPDIRLGERRESAHLFMRWVKFNVTTHISVMIVNASVFVMGC